MLLSERIKALPPPGGVYFPMVACFRDVRPGVDTTAAPNWSGHDLRPARLVWPGSLDDPSWFQPMGAPVSKPA